MVIKISCSKLRDSDEIPPTHKKRKKEKKRRSKFINDFGKRQFKAQVFILTIIKLL